MLELFQSKFKDSAGTEWELNDYLRHSHAAVSICMSSLHITIVEDFRYLNSKKIPIIARVVVDDAEGCWTNPANIQASTLKTYQIIEWAKENDIRLQTVGFDSEKPLDLIANTARTNIVELAKSFIDYRKQRKEAAADGDPQAQFDGLLQALEAQSIITEIYAFPHGLKTLPAGIGITSAQDRRVVEIVYTGGVPTKLQSLTYRALKSPYKIPAFVIVTGKEDETPGRDFERITQAKIIGMSLEETPKGELPAHLSEQDLVILIREWLKQEIELDNKVFNMRELYLFAINDAKVALMLMTALNQAFENKKADHTE